MIQRGQKIEWFKSIVDEDYNKTFQKLQFVSSEETDWTDCPTRALTELLAVINVGGKTVEADTKTLRNFDLFDETSILNGEFVDGVALSMLREDFDRTHGAPDEW